MVGVKVDYWKNQRTRNIQRWLRNGLIQIRQPLVVPPSTTSPKGSENAVPVSGPV